MTTTPLPPELLEELARWDVYVNLDGELYLTCERRGCGWKIEYWAIPDAQGYANLADLLTICQRVHPTCNITIQGEECNPPSTPPGLPSNAHTSHTSTAAASPTCA